MEDNPFKESVNLLTLLRSTLPAGYPFFRICVWLPQKKKLRNYIVQYIAYFVVCHNKTCLSLLVLVCIHEAHPWRSHYSFLFLMLVRMFNTLHLIYIPVVIRFNWEVILFTPKYSGVNVTILYLYSRAMGGGGGYLYLSSSCFVSGTKTKISNLLYRGTNFQF